MDPGIGPQQKRTLQAMHLAAGAGSGPLLLADADFPLAVMPCPAFAVQDLELLFISTLLFMSTLLFNSTLLFITTLLFIRTLLFISTQLFKKKKKNFAIVHCCSLVNCRH